MVLNNNDNVKLVGLDRFLEKAARYLLGQDDGGIIEDEELAEMKRAEENFVMYMLTGRSPTHPDVPRTGIDVFLNSLTVERARTVIQTCRDFDSLIGISSSLPYSKSLYVWPTPRFNDNLSKDNHLRKDVLTSGLTNPVSMSLHAIPNMGFAGLHNDTSHHIIRLCFPWLADGGAPSRAAISLSQEKMALVYDQCIRPAVEEVLKAEESYWPLTYDHENWRSTRRNGGHITTGVCVPAELVDSFGATVLKNVRALEFGRDAFFLHEFRGMKHTSRHLADEMELQAVKDALKRFLESLSLIIYPTEETEEDREDWELEGEWYIDVGIEINSQENPSDLPDSDNHSRSSVLQWRRDAHQRLILAALRCTDEEAEEIARNRGIDEVAHFAEIAGFRRVLPRRIADRLGVNYLNCYTTDKNVTTTYSTLLGGLSEDLLARNNVSQALNSRLDKLFWLPYATTERPWMTKTGGMPYKTHYRSFPSDCAHGTAPWVVVNPKYTFKDVLWTYTRGPVPDVFIKFLLAEAEEEKEEEEEEEEEEMRE